jgi:uncharacterized protein (TIGR03086 family)
MASDSRATWGSGLRPANCLGQRARRFQERASLVHGEDGEDVVLLTVDLCSDLAHQAGAGWGHRQLIRAAVGARCASDQAPLFEQVQIADDAVPAVAQSGGDLRLVQPRRLGRSGQDGVLPHRQTDSSSGSVLNAAQGLGDGRQCGQQIATFGRHPVTILEDRLQSSHKSDYLSHVTIDRRTAHREALAGADTRVGALDVRDLARPTPCDGWLLADLLAHMIGQHRGFARAVRDGTAAAEAYAPVGFTPDAWHGSVTALLTAFAHADLDRLTFAVELSSRPIPNSRIVEAQLLDTVVHTWDIGQAVGEDFRPRAETIAIVAALASSIPDAARGPGAAFGQPTASDGTPWAHTLALVGRRAATPPTARAEE